MSVAVVEVRSRISMGEVSITEQRVPGKGMDWIISSEGETVLCMKFESGMSRT